MYITVLSKLIHNLSLSPTQYDHTNKFLPLTNKMDIVKSGDVIPLNTVVKDRDSVNLLYGSFYDPEEDLISINEEELGINSTLPCDEYKCICVCLDESESQPNDSHEVKLFFVVYL